MTDELKLEERARIKIDEQKTEAARAKILQLAGKLRLRFSIAW